MRHTFAVHARSIVGVAASLVTSACGSAGSTPRDSLHASSGDARTPLALPADGHQAVLGEMRQMLAAIGGALAAASRGDSAAVVQALAPAGSAAAADPALESLLPPAWKELAERTHGGFDSLSAAVRRTRSPDALKDSVLVGVSRITGSCNACHEAFRVTVR